MLQIVCINAGNYLGRGKEYVQILADMVSRNLAEGYEGQFTVFTDDPEDYPGINKRPLPHDGLNGWFNKLALFKKGVFDEGDRVIFLDLDTVLAGPLDDIFAYNGKFAILRDFYRPWGKQSSVMAWTPCEDTYHIWNSFEASEFPNMPGGDQEWIELTYQNPDIWQDLYPGRFVSFKVHCKDGPPKKSSVIVFHGNPRPHDVGGWVEKIWCIDGATVPEMLCVGNTSEDQVIENVKHAISLNLPELQAAEAHDGCAVLIGGGPSLKHSLADIKRHKDAGHIIFATNNTYKFLHENGVTPDFHVMLDARPENAEFVPDMATGYYASQCDASVFDRAKKAILWHTFEVADIVEGPHAFIGCGSTVGLKSIGLVAALGYRNIHIYGYDSSYSDDDHHAYDQALNNDEKIIGIQVGEVSFKASPWMATQANEFVELVPQLTSMGCEITVHGSGLIPYLAMNFHQLPNAADERAEAILSRLVGVKDPVGVEVGVFTGELSKRLLMRNDLKLTMVDSWIEHGKDSDYAKSGDYHGNLLQEEQDGLYHHTLAVTSFAGDRARVIRKDSLASAHDIEDGSLDFVFLDADHTYEAVKADIAAWVHKVKPGGLLCGHDYENDDFPAWGVKQAVDEIGLPVEKGLNFTWFTRIP